MSQPLTSLVPTIVEITGFMQSNWPHIWWFPNWYLGVPLRFVTGPVVPLLTILINKFSGLPLESSYVVLIILMWILGGFGVWKLVHELGGGKRAGWSACGLFLLLPGHILLSTYGNGLHHLVISLLPWICFLWFKTLKHWQVAWIISTLILLSAVLLIDVGGILLFIVAGVLITLMGDKRDWGTGGLKSILLIITALSIATIWYTPRFWWTLLGNPSFGGKPLANVIPFILQLLQALIPLILGAWFVQRKYRLRNGLMRFGVLFGSSFLFLTVIRFLSDIDFWMDWTSYILELQFALALVLPVVVFKLVQRTKTIQIITFLNILTLTIIDSGLAFMLYKTDEKVVAYQVGIRKLAGENVKLDQRIFLSGSPVFWLGSAKQNLLQVRGGRDEIATHPTWAMGAYNIREGEDHELLNNWLSIFGVSKILVHEEGSQEYFRDFKNIDRFDELVEIEEKDGNALYEHESSIARLASKDILEIPSPQEGSDENALVRYSDALGVPVNFIFTKANEIRVNTDLKLQADQVISLAVTHDKYWKLIEGKGKLLADVFGNTVILPEPGETSFVLSYQEKESWLAGVLLSLIALLALLKSDRVTGFIFKRVPSVKLSQVDEEETY